MTIELREVVYRYPGRARAPALAGITFEIAAGCVTALVGPNGSGKSTALGIAAGVLKPTSGHAAWGGGGLDAASRAMLGVTFQTIALDPLLTVAESLTLAARTAWLGGARGRARVEACARRFGVADRLGERVGRLSGGLMRRVDLARADLAEPRWLVLDEPTSGLDEAGAGVLREWMRERAACGGAVALATHDLAMAAEADRVLLIDAGRVVAHGPPAALCVALGEASLMVVGWPRGERRASAVQALDSVRALGTPIDLGARSGVCGDAEALAAAGRELIALGAQVTLGPPTLAEVFAARTGRALRDGEAER